MSSHFNYEIDEHRLRARLKSMEIPYKEDSWVQFETYSDLHRATQKSSPLSSFRLNINRTLILPFVFGGVIILFSLLLFNFISIKNKNPGNAQNAEIPRSRTPEPKKEPALAKPVPVKAEEQKTQNLPVKETVVTPTHAAIPAPTVQIVQAVAAEIKPATNTVTAVDVPAGSWTSLATGKIYSSPNIASSVIGNSDVNHTYTAIGETNYFIKIAFEKNDQSETGYIRKDALRKNNGQLTTAGSFTQPGRKKNRKAETLESIHTPVILSGGSSEEKEPELK